MRIEYFNDNDEDTVLQFRWKSDEKGIKEKTVITGALLKTANPAPAPVVSCKGTALQAVRANKSCGGVLGWRVLQAWDSLHKAVTTLPPCPHVCSRRRPAADGVPERQLSHRLWRLCCSGALQATGEDDHAGALCDRGAQHSAIGAQGSAEGLQQQACLLGHQARLAHECCRPCLV